MSGFNLGNTYPWLPHEESKYAEDFVEEEDSFLILPTRNEQVENIEAEIANASNCINEAQNAPTVDATSLPTQQSSNSFLQPVQHMSLEGYTVEQTSLPRTSLESNKMVDSLPEEITENDKTQYPSLFSAMPSVSSSECSLDETSMLMSKLSLQSCKEKMVEMTESAAKNLITLQLSIATLREEQQKKYDECGEKIRTLRSANQMLTTELAQTKAKIVEDSAQYEKYTIEISKLEAEITENAKNTIEGQIQREELLKKLDETASQNKELKEILRHCEIQMSKGKQNMSDKLALQEERNVLNEAWEASKVTITQLQTIRLSKEEEITQLNRELEECRGITNKMKECAAKKDDNNEKLNSALEQAGEKLRQFQALVVEKDLEITNLQTRMAVITSENDQKEIFRQQMEEYKSNFEDERRDRMATRDRVELLKDKLASATLQFEQKNTEFVELHRTHLRLANEHVNRQPTTNGTDSGPKPNVLPHVAAKFTHKISSMFQSVVPSKLWDEDVRVNPNPSGENNSASGATAGSQPPSSAPTLGPQNPPPCPLCNKKFACVGSLERHAANCGIEAAAARTDPFGFP